MYLFTEQCLLKICPSRVAESNVYNGDR